MNVINIVAIDNIKLNVINIKYVIFPLLRPDGDSTT